MDKIRELRKTTLDRIELTYEEVQNAAAEAQARARKFYSNRLASSDRPDWIYRSRVLSVGKQVFRQVSVVVNKPRRKK